MTPDIGDALEGRDAWERYAHRLEARLAAVKALADEAWTFRTAPDLGDAIQAALGSPS